MRLSDSQTLKSEWVQNQFIKLQVFWMQIDQLLQALLANGVLNDSENAF